jgi:hypothetical protein
MSFLASPAPSPACVSMVPCRLAAGVVIESEWNEVVALVVVDILIESLRMNTLPLQQRTEGDVREADTWLPHPVMTQALKIL